MGTDIHIVAEVKKAGQWVPANVAMPDDRDYWTFAILADVRNGVGFAGCDLGDAIPPIAQPRGLPKNFDPSKHPDFWADHSESYHTLKQLLKYPYKSQKITQRGYVTAEAAKAYREKGEAPESWFGFTDRKGYEQIEWKTPLSEAAPLFGWIIKALKPLGEPERVRIVFGFDS